MIDYLTAKEALEQAVAIKGEDFAFDSFESSSLGCLYANSDGSPCCIVGTALHLLDIPLPDPASEENSYVFSPYANFASTYTNKFLNRILLEQGYEFDERASELFRLAQVEQDEGMTWGKALRLALAKVESDGK